MKNLGEPFMTVGMKMILGGSGSRYDDQACNDGATIQKEEISIQRPAIHDDDDDDDGRMDASLLSLREVYKWIILRKEIRK